MTLPTKPTAARDVLIEWIDHILERKGWTGTELARHSDLAPSTVLRLLNDPNHRFIPSLKTLQKMADGSGYPIPRTVTEALGATRMEPGSEAVTQEYGSSSGVGPRYVPASRKPSTVDVMYVSTLPSTLHPLVHQDVRVPAPAQMEGDETCFAFYMPDSLLEPWIKAGALLYATKRRDPIVGDFILVTDDKGRSKVRLVKDIDESGFHLASADINAKPDVVSFDVISEIAVVGIIACI
jgi:transcriptional regulator with XRE-family HTH domain